MDNTKELKNQEVRTLWEISKLKRLLSQYQDELIRIRKQLRRVE